MSCWASGCRPSASANELGQSSEALEGVALLAQTLRREGVPSPTLDRLVALVDGRIEPEAFTAHVTAPAGRQSEAVQALTAGRAAAADGARRSGAAESAGDGEDVALAGVAGERARPEPGAPPQ